MSKPTVGSRHGGGGRSRPGLTRVVVVSYHTGFVLQDCVAAVLGQSAPVELVLVDNGNPVEVVEWLEERARSDSRLTVLSGHGNVGFGRACNMGVSASTNAPRPWDSVLFLNPDGVVGREVVERTLRARAEVGGRAMMGARLVDSGGGEQRGCRRNRLTPRTALGEMLRLDRLPVIGWPRLDLTAEPVPLKVSEVPAISGAFMFFRRDDLACVGGFDPEYFLHAEDLDLCMRFHKAGGRIYYVPTVEVLHHGGTSEVKSRFVERCKADSFALYFRKHFPRHGWWIGAVMAAALGARWVGRSVASAIRPRPAA